MRAGLIALALYVTAAVGLMLLLDPIPQDPACHRFAAAVGGCLLWMLYRRRAAPGQPV